ncbi:MAG: glutamate-1-semialdehyde 2,1-aminomutase [Anaerolineaceae bacterium]|nr:glutamate-1-semialdehyde 2,1-aminomutase [Anaerolineaceae bacterium]
MEIPKSRAAFEAARRVIVGGVNSPVRAFAAVGGQPLFIARGQGQHIFDLDGNRYLDYVGSWGPLVLGHCHPAVVEAVQRALRDGMSFGAPTERETRLAEILCQAVPSIEQIRFVNSGTEATLSAIRLARGCTGRDLVVKFAGCYHGHVDALLVQAGSGAMTLGQPSSPGVPAAVVADTLVARYNDTAGISELVAERGDGIAAVIVEPVAGNMGVVPAEPEFLFALRKLCDEKGIILIFDEVMSGFRVAWGGAQELYGIQPDLTTLGKIIGGGMPVGAYGGRRRIMEQVSPEGPVYQAGTLSGNPLAMACGLATLEVLSQPETYQRLETLSERLAEGLQKAARRCGLAMHGNRVGSMLCAFFTGQVVRDYESAAASDTEMFGRYFNGMLQRGVYLAPSQFEAMFLSTAHTADDVQETLDAAGEVFKELAAV